MWNRFLKIILAAGIVLAYHSPGHARDYGRIINKSSFKASFWRNHAGFDYGKQLSMSNAVHVGLSYLYDTERDVFFYKNFLVDVGLAATMLRQGRKLYLDGSFALFYVRTEASSDLVAGFGENGGGLAFGARLAYYLSDRLVPSVEVRQLLFLRSSFFQSKVLFGAGIGIVL